MAVLISVNSVSRVFPDESTIESAIFNTFPVYTKFCINYDSSIVEAVVNSGVTPEEIEMEGEIGPL